jgi:hypothetical protein
LQEAYAFSTETPVYARRTRVFAELDNLLIKRGTPGRDVGKRFRKSGKRLPKWGKKFC